ncbi:hypothetical protein [Methylobacterium sp. Leaf85]|uniref:hypothetical protein n=1 Tax=Methylobacterium sp. Leaf85 TaxID=1736241 RepID=UPI0006F73D83|nr:hypothetical protein [Methylobacterium sp. Leaf85]KQO53078.1 hypothetical protein ASF08_19325 [Methylobacterium sp. Leaf85]
MAALTTNRLTRNRSGDLREPLVKANAVIFAGAMAAIDASGFAVPAASVAAHRVLGMAERQSDNTGGANGAIRVPVRTGIFQFDNSASADLIGLKDIGQPCYVVDDHTVALTSNSAARPVAGTIFDVDQLGVWVEFS